MLAAVVNYYLGVGQGLFLLFFLFALSLYLMWRIAIDLLLVKLRGDKHALQHAIQLVKASAWFAAGLIVVLSIVGLIVREIDGTAAERADIAANNNTLMAMDKALFNVYPPLWFQQTDNIFKPFFDATMSSWIYLYGLLTIVMTFAFIYLFALNRRLFMQLLTAFFLCMALSFPFWYAFPAISPLVSYWHPIIEQDIPEDVQTQLDQYQPNEILAAYLQRVAEARDSVKDKIIIVTTIPSMHIAWGTLVVYYLSVAWRPFLIGTIPFFLLNNISTLVTMQHYAVDVIAGIIVAVLAIIIARYVPLHRLPQLRPLFNTIEDDVSSLRKQLPKLALTRRS